MNKMLFVCFLASIAIFITVPVKALSYLPSNTNILINVPDIQKIKPDVLVDRFISNHPNGQKVKKLLDFINGKTGFVPFRDIKQVWLFVKEGSTKKENRPGLIAEGNFNPAKIEGFLNKLGNKINARNEGNLRVYSDKKGKISLTFLSSTRLLIGHPTMVDAYLAGQGSNGNNFFSAPSVAHLKSLFNKKAYLQVIVHNPKRMKEKMQKKGARNNKPVAQFLHRYLTNDVSPKAVFIQLNNRNLEGQVLYTRGKNEENIKASIQFSDPTIHLNAIVNHIIENIGNMGK